MRTKIIIMRYLFYSQLFFFSESEGLNLSILNQISIYNRSKKLIPHQFTSKILILNNSHVNIFPYANIAYNYHEINVREAELYQKAIKPFIQNSLRKWENGEAKEAGSASRPL